MNRRARWRTLQSVSTGQPSRSTGTVQRTPSECSFVTRSSSNFTDGSAILCFFLYSLSISATNRRNKRNGKQEKSAKPKDMVDLRFVSDVYEAHGEHRLWVIFCMNGPNCAPKHAASCSSLQKLQLLPKYLRIPLTKRRNSKESTKG